MDDLITNALAPASQPENRDGTGNKRKANQTSWKKGQSGNPKGRAKKGETWKDMSRRILAEEKMNGPDGKKISYREAMIRSAVLNAIGGNYSFFRELWDRDEGTVLQQVSMSLSQETPENKAIREEMRQLLDRAAQDPAKRDKILKLQAAWFALESEMSDLASGMVDVTPEATEHES